jgi:hypothetical protein
MEIKTDLLYLPTLPIITHLMIILELWPAGSYSTPLQLFYKTMYDIPNFIIRKLKFREVKCYGLNTGCLYHNSC